CIATHSAVKRFVDHKLPDHSLPITTNGGTLPIPLERVISIPCRYSIQFANWKVKRDSKPEVRICGIAELLAPGADSLKSVTRKKSPRLRYIHHPTEIHREIERTLNIGPDHPRLLVDQLHVAINQADSWVTECLNRCFNSAVNKQVIGALNASYLALG